MMCRQLITLMVLFFSLTALPTSDLLADETDQLVKYEGVIEEDLYVAGDRIDMRAQVNGDVIAAGAQVRIDNQVTGDILAVGGRVDIRAQVYDDVRAAGGEVSVADRVDGDVIVAGGHVRLEKSAKVGGRAWLAGGEIEVDGQVGQELRVAGGDVILAGRIKGDVTFFADTVRILPTAQLAGDLVYHSPRKAVISSQAVIAGTITHLPLEYDDERYGHGMELIVVLALFVCGAVFFLVYPHFVLGTLATFGEKPALSFGTGLVILFVTPPLAALLVLTVIGCILGVVILLLYVLLLLVGFLMGMLTLGDGLLRLARQPQDIARTRRLLSLAAAFLVLWLAGFIPVISTLIIIGTTLLGSGALMLQIYRMYNAHRIIEGEA